MGKNIIILSVFTLCLVPVDLSAQETQGDSRPSTLFQINETNQPAESPGYSLSRVMRTYNGQKQMMDAFLSGRMAQMNKLAFRHYMREAKRANETRSSLSSLEKIKRCTAKARNQTSFEKTAEISRETCKEIERTWDDETCSCPVAVSECLLDTDGDGTLEVYGEAACQMWAKYLDGKKQEWEQFIAENNLEESEQLAKKPVVHQPERFWDAVKNELNDYTFYPHIFAMPTPPKGRMPENF